jgi:phosphohistidine phosphatase SixA
MIQNGYGNMWTPAQPVQAAVSDTKLPTDKVSVSTQPRAQETAQAKTETQTQERVNARDQAQASNASSAIDAIEQYKRTGHLSVFA